MKVGLKQILDHMDYINMHLPYSNMGKKALAYDYRGQRFPEFVRFLRNRGYYGDASLGRGRGAFAVRTQSIVNHQRLSQS